MGGVHARTNVHVNVNVNVNAHVNVRQPDNGPYLSEMKSWKVLPSAAPRSIKMHFGVVRVDLDQAGSLATHWHGGSFQDAWNEVKLFRSKFPEAK